MRLLLWHGYLLDGTGSNVYTRQIARAWAALGHEVVVACQDPDPGRIAEGVRIVRPAIGRLVPVFVVDRYRDLEARRVGDFSDGELAAYVHANAEAVRAELERAPTALVFANHALMGGPVAAAASAAADVPYAIKIHGSELEYAIRGNPRLAAMAAPGLAGAAAVFAGSHHIVSVTRELIGDGPYLERTHVVPPGVDIELFRPDGGSMLELLELLAADAGAGERHPDRDAGERLRGVGRFLLYVGKLMEQKGVRLLLDAWAELGPAYPELSLVLVGFGDDRAALEAAAPPRTIFTGAMTHEQLARLVPLAEAAAVPSVLAEAFGMVAAEQAACGVVPVVSDHSGLAEVAEGLGDAGRTFDGTAADLAGVLDGVLRLPAAERARLGAVARAAVVKRWSWTGVARRLIADTLGDPR